MTHFSEINILNLIMNKRPLWLSMVNSPDPVARAKQV